jgi:hypothetical protein
MWLAATVVARWVVTVATMILAKTLWQGLESRSLLCRAVVQQTAQHQVRRTVRFLLLVVYLRGAVRLTAHPMAEVTALRLCLWSAFQMHTWCLSVCCPVP